MSRTRPVLNAITLDHREIDVLIASLHFVVDARNAADRAEFVDALTTARRSVGVALDVPAQQTFDAGDPVNLGISACIQYLAHRFLRIRVPRHAGGCDMARKTISKGDAEDGHKRTMRTINIDRLNLQRLRLATIKLAETLE